MAQSCIISNLYYKNYEGDTMKKNKTHVFDILPCVGYGLIGGMVTGFLLFFYKFAANKTVEFSQEVYSFIHENPVYIPALFAGLIVFACVMAAMQKKIPEMKGGGIPRCEGILRGILSFRRVKTLAGTAIGSLISFFCGLPLGSEGPAVIIGTSIGGLCMGRSGRKSAWSRYVMTGSAAAGFAVATGAPLAAILFALEEIHRKFTHLLVISVSTTVLSATFINELLCSFYGIESSLIPAFDFPDFELKNILPLIILGVIVAVSVGVFDACLGFFGKMKKRMKRKMKNGVPEVAKLIVVFVLAGVLGLFFREGAYSGHDIVENILSYGESLPLLFAILAVRLAMMMLVTDSGATGGIFIPTLAVGALVGAIAGRFLVFAGMPAELFPSVVVLGMCSFMGGALRAPLTATIIFIEITCNFTNFFYVALVIFIVNTLISFFHQQSFYDRVLEKLEHDYHAGKTPQIVSFKMKISAGSFVDGKTVHDILWPSSSVVVGITKADNNIQDMDDDGEKKLFADDTVVIKAKVFDKENYLKILKGLVGEQYEIEECNQM